MYLVCLIGLLLAVMGLGAEKIRRINSSVWSCGIYFGLLCLLADSFLFRLNGVCVPIGIRDAPVITAAFFFSPAAGIIAGCIGSLGQALMVNFGNFDFPVITVFSPLCVALYAAGMAQWVFERRRPMVITAAVSAFYGGLINMSLVYIAGSIRGLEVQMLDVLRIIYPSVPLSTALSLGATAVIFGSWRDWRNRYFYSLNGIMLFLGVSIGLVVEVVNANAFDQTRSTIVEEGIKLAVQIENQIDYGLHGNAEQVLKLLKGADKFPQSMLQKYAELLNIDEICVFNADGVLLGSNLPDVLKYRPDKWKKSSKIQSFLQLTAGKKNFIKQDFRPSLSDSSNISKYIGIPFPDRRAFLQLGFSYKRLEKEFATYFFPMFDKATLGGKGCFIITDKKGKIVAPVAGFPDAEGKMMSDIGVFETGQNLQVNNFDEFELYDISGQIYRCPNVGEWRLYAFLPYTRFFTVAVRQCSVFGLTLFIICILFRLVHIRIVKAQKKIDEMRAADLELAATIQNSELPETSFENSNCRILAKMTPAREVGGDFYDHYVLPDGRIAVTVADVSGKGVPAAIFMMKAKNILKALVNRSAELPQSMALTNARLNRNNNAAMFVTAWSGIFDPASGTLSYVSAGHNPPLIVRQNNSVEWLRPAKRQKPLAAFPDSVYQSCSTVLLPGDRLFLYTDGVTEAMDDKGQLFGESRLENELKQQDGELINTISEKLKQFTGSAPVADDITILTLEIKK